MNTIRITMISLFATVVLPLAGCSQLPTTLPNEEAQVIDLSSVVEAPASEARLSTQALAWQTTGLYNPPSSDPKMTKDLGEFSAVVLNGAGNPVIAYYDGTRSSHAPGTSGDTYGNGDLKLMVCGNPTCTSGNTFTTVDRGRTLFTEDVGKHISMVLDRRGFPVISYVSEVDGLKLARCLNPTCTGRSIHVVAPTGSYFDNVGQTSLALNSGNKPVISFAASKRTTPDSVYLYLARCADSNCDSRYGIPTIKPAGRGRGNALALDKNDNAIISHHDAVTQDLKVARCLRDDTSTYPCPTVTVDSVGDVGQYNALKLVPIKDLSGTVTKEIPFISYYDATNGDLKIAYCGDIGCTRNNFILTLDSAGDVGRFTAQPRGNASKFAISYYDATNSNLKFAVCDPGQLLAKTPVMPCQDTRYNALETADGDVRADVGQNNSMVLDASGKAIISYYNATERTLKWARQQ